MGQNDKSQKKKLIFWRLTAYLKPYKFWVVAGAVSNIGLGVMALPPPLVFGAITNKVVLDTAAPTSDRMHLLGIYMLWLLGIYAANAVFNYTRIYFMQVLAENIIRDLRKHIYSRVQMLSVSYFDNHRTGEIMSRVTNDTEAVEEFVTRGADTIICDSARLAATIILMLVLSWKLAVVSMVIVPIVFLTTMVFSKRIRALYRMVRERLAEVNSRVQENISGIRVIKSFAREDSEFDNFVRNIGDYFQMRISAVHNFVKFYTATDFVIRVGRLAVWIVGPLLIMRGESNMGDLVIFTLYLGTLEGAVGNLARVTDTVQRSLAAAERIFEIIDEEPSIKDADDAVELADVKGRVEFDHVYFGYQGSDEVLKDICITAEPGQIVALVGRSGAGKTSIVSLIPRFYDPLGGRILIDGIDVRKTTQKSLRRRIAMVLQDTFLFNGTVRDNIKYGKLDANEEEMIEASKAANCHEFIEKFKCGYDTEIGERGVKLSGGQKQRVAIARAVLADPRILILDEATSSVDSESEYLIHKAMDRMMEGRTTFVIAHRLSTIKHADVIVTLEDGCVRETGSHQALLDLEGIYSQMYEMQFKLNKELS